MLTRLFKRFFAGHPQPTGGADFVSGVTEVLDPGAPYVDGEPVPRWPEHGAALVAVQPEILVETQRDLINRIRQSGPLVRAEFDRLIMPVFYRYAAWVHLLPASEAHHHFGPGGLLRHGFEVAAHAARIADGKQVGMEISPSERALYAPRWKVATMLGGLLHDIGKPLVDCGATDAARTRTWPAQAGSLFDWLTKNGLGHYRIYWRPGQRHERHKPVGTAVAREILGPELLEWLSEDSTHEVADLIMLSIAQGRTQANIMSQVIAKADSLSVEADLKETAKRTQGSGQGGARSVAALIMAELRGLAESNQLPLNVPGSPLWWTTDGLFAIYPTIFEDIIPRMVKKNIASVPASRAELAALLAEHGFIERCYSGESPPAQVSDTWDLSLEIVHKDQVMTAPIVRALRFVNAEYAVGALPMPKPVTGASRPPFVTAEELAQVTVKVAGPDEDARAGQEGGGAGGVAEEGEPQHQVVATQMGGTEHKEPAPVGTKAPANPHVADRRNRPDLARERSVEERRRIEAKDGSKGQAGYAELVAKLEHDGLQGAAMVEIFKRLESGGIAWGSDAAETPDGLAIRYPGCFDRLGIAPEDLIGALAERRWLVVDDGNARKVSEWEFPSGRRTKCLIFTGLVQQTWEALRRERPEVLEARPKPMPKADRAVPDVRRKEGGSPAAEPARTPRKSKIDSPAIGAKTLAMRGGPSGDVLAVVPSANEETVEDVPMPKRSEDIHAQNVEDLTPERVAKIKAIALVVVERQARRDGREAAALTSKELKSMLIEFAARNKIAMVPLGTALLKGSNPLILAAMPDGCDFGRVDTPTLNPSYVAPAWATERISQYGEKALGGGE